MSIEQQQGFSVILDPTISTVAAEAFPTDGAPTSSYPFTGVGVMAMVYLDGILKNIGPSRSNARMCTALYRGKTGSVNPEATRESGESVTTTRAASESSDEDIVWPAGSNRQSAAEMTAPASFTWEVGNNRVFALSSEQTFWGGSEKYHLARTRFQFMGKFSTFGSIAGATERLNVADPVG